MRDKMSEIFEIAYKKYPMLPEGYFGGEVVDSNSDARQAYLQGFMDGMEYAVKETKSKHDEKGGE
jgi:hypothetical protein